MCISEKCTRLEIMDSEYQAYFKQWLRAFDKISSVDFQGCNPTWTFRVANSDSVPVQFICVLFPYLFSCFFSSTTSLLDVSFKQLTVWDHEVSSEFRSEG